jgi:hypothetical protein
MCQLDGQLSLQPLGTISRWKFAIHSNFSSEKSSHFFTPKLISEGVLNLESPVTSTGVWTGWSLLSGQQNRDSMNNRNPRQLAGELLMKLECCRSYFIKLV